MASNCAEFRHSKISIGLETNHLLWQSLVRDVNALLWKNTCSAMHHSGRRVVHPNNSNEIINDSNIAVRQNHKYHWDNLGIIFHIAVITIAKTEHSDVSRKCSSQLEMLTVAVLPALAPPEIWKLPLSWSAVISTVTLEGVPWQGSKTMLGFPSLGLGSRKLGVFLGAFLQHAILFCSRGCMAFWHHLLNGWLNSRLPIEATQIGIKHGIPWVLLSSFWDDSTLGYICIWATELLSRARNWPWYQRFILVSRQEWIYLAGWMPSCFCRMWSLQQWLDIPNSTCSWQCLWVWLPASIQSISQFYP